MPPGTTPPLILNYNASTVPILQLALSGEGLSEQNAVRSRPQRDPHAAGHRAGRRDSVSVRRQVAPGADRPRSGGAAGARACPAQDVANALAAQNLITPVGTQKIGEFEYTVQLNNAPRAIEDLGDLPIKVVNGATVYIRDVAHVRDGNAPQTNIVHVDGARSVLMSILKNGATSTLDIVAGIKQKLAEIKPSLPDNLEVTPINDQSLFVRAAIKGVAFEGVDRGGADQPDDPAVPRQLALDGDHRGLDSAVGARRRSSLLSLLGETLNIMTLGGLALAVGILVDDATVTIENINWHLEQGKDVETAILDGAAQIVTPAFVSLLCICIVFVPMFFLEGVARFLFVPMAEAVMFAMVVLVHPVAHAGADDGEVPAAASTRTTRRPRRAAAVAQSAGAFPARLRSALRALPRRLPRPADARASRIAACSSSASSRSCWPRSRCVPFLGRNFFPSVDGGQILMHVRAQVGTRVEEAAQPVRRRAEGDPRDHSAARDRRDGRQHRPVDLEHQPDLQQHRRRSATQDGDIQIALQGRPRADRRLRARSCARSCRGAFPASRSRSRRPTSSARS